MSEKLSFNGWPNCRRLTNGEIDIVVATDIGPRILRVGFVGSQNFLYLRPEDAGKTGGSDWRIYGGHRLWHAPEAIPRTYYPDNVPVKVAETLNTVLLTQAMEETTGIVKEIEISLPSSGTTIKVQHRLMNKGSLPASLSPWAITMMAPGGLAVIPQEPFGEEDDYLLPARALVLWQYAQMGDPRWRWGDRYILAKQDPALIKAQKIGLLNKQGWVAYTLENEIFVKRFPYRQGMPYPDYHCNNEIYFNGSFLELESLAPACPILPGGIAEHTEYWTLAKQQPGTNENDIGEMVNDLPKESEEPPAPEFLKHIPQD